MFRRAHNKSAHHNTDNNWRITFLSVVFLLFAALMIGRLFQLQVIKGGVYAAMASDQHNLYKKLIPERGTIYAVEGDGEKRVLFPLVTNQMLYLVFASPKEIEDSTSTAEKLFNIIGLPEENDERIYAERVISSSTIQLASSSPQMIKRQELISNWISIFNQKEKQYFPIRERLTAEKIKELDGLDIKGINWSEKSYRYYTEQGIGGQLFGFWGFEGNERKGKYGLEGYYDDLLSGQMGELKIEKDVKGNMIALGENEKTDKVDGADLILTINRAIQYKACESLKKSIADHKAKSGSVIVMDPSTGAILAMCSFPDFDPDKYFEVDDPSSFNNKAIFDAYEPGSIFKPFTMAAAIDAGAVTPDTTYIDTGVVDYKDYKIRNFEDKSYGLSSMTKVLEYSINTGVIYAMRQMTTKVFTQYVKKFGFGETTGIELNKEMPGNIANLNKKGEINTATATFGQGITATPLQLITAFASLVNGGKLMKPYVVSQVIRNNEVIESNSPEVVRQVISPKTSLLIKSMLVSVVENGHAKKAQIIGYRVGGKTGTAQVPAKGGGYKSDDSIIGSFIGFAPFNNPRIVIMVRVDEPMEGRLGETVAAPVFTEVAKFALQYYNVPRDK
ncbi:MAG: penicillin-binding protein 2 [Candidatus Buchananbacteria bacterium]|jgi:cell division protein FtsI/penicillin-binding protein 2